MICAGYDSFETKQTGNGGQYGEQIKEIISKSCFGSFPYDGSALRCYSLC